MINFGVSSGCVSALGPDRVRSHWLTEQLPEIPASVYKQWVKPDPRMRENAHADETEQTPAFIPVHS